MLSANDVTEMVNLYRDALDAGNCVVEEYREMGLNSYTWAPYLNHEWDASYKSTVDIKRLTELATKVSTIPEGVVAQSRVEKIYADRAEMAR